MSNVSTDQQVFCKYEQILILMAATHPKKEVGTFQLRTGN